MTKFMTGLIPNKEPGYFLSEAKGERGGSLLVVHFVSNKKSKTNFFLIYLHTKLQMIRFRDTEELLEDPNRCTVMQEVEPKVH